jgi:hypothetical protein
MAESGSKRALKVGWQASGGRSDGGHDGGVYDSDEVDTFLEAGVLSDRLPSDEHTSSILFLPEEFQIVAMLFRQ